MEGYTTEKVEFVPRETYRAGGGFVLVRNPSQLPRELPRLYARLTG